MIRVIALDPGSYHLGVCYAEVSPHTFKPVLITTATVNVDTLPVVWDNTYTTVDSKRRAHVLYSYMLDLYNRFSPHQLAYERPFYGKFRPNAFESLLSTLSVITNSYLSYNSYGLHFGYPPHSVKKAVHANTKGGKDAVKEAILGNADIGSLLTKASNDYTEHEYDAIAVLVAHCAKLKNDPTGSETWLRKQ